MALSIEPVIKASWMLFVLYWLWGWRRVKDARRSEPVLPRLLKYWLPLMLAALLIGPEPWFHGTWLGSRVYPATLAGAVSGALLTMLGVAFACWARQVLGRNWSSVVQVKQDHELIQAGPYRWVRHPIYTGLLLAFLGTAVAIGEWRGALAVVIVALSFWFKLRLEERWMRENFGASYEQYMQRTKALIPGVL
ncbi:Protein-S-isoprenylcysteine O-methyltransferase Ste14 [Dyella jiangningensis]|uniref:methyltransferase family protein n=1 Tax=Dyella sp. AtDHG13 TaxID=1938897 RepID=UPI00087DF8F1|nr:isoprenylcysteine carboxylmethyltransferase family protein [Dyella sp. AtDHG13]PXV55353.1 protein-S-isoprenylcysteine O-methyltransferase Ste14 [Dyella sp. AtDHG13]SDK79603.1 Protein-S-isoprenylcysteine O-methyltransferase Ste14 [Dyella jiangningensis]